MISRYASIHINNPEAMHYRHAAPSRLAYLDTSHFLEPELLTTMNIRLQWKTAPYRRFASLPMRSFA